MRIRIVMSVWFVGLLAATSLAGDGPERVPLARLFVAPSAQVIESAAVHFAIGGVFTAEQEQGVLGLARLGLGDVAELEITSLDVTSNTSLGTISVPTKAFKLRLLPDRIQRNYRLPYIALAFKGSNWTGFRSNTIAILRDASLAHAGVTEVTYESRFTSLFFLVTAKGEHVELHFGPSLTDFRHRNLWVATIDDFPYQREDEVAESRAGGFIGIVAEANPTSQIIIEAQTLPRLKYKPALKEVKITNDLLVVLGVRFFVIDYISIDTGVRYLDSFDGLADMQLRLAANLYFPVKKLVEKVRERNR